MKDQRSALYKIVFTFLVFGLCTISASAVVPSLGTPSQAERPPDLVEIYKTTPNGDLRLYFYLPRNWKRIDRRAAMITFHGGAFNTGIPDSYFATSEYFAGRGLVSCSVEYRVPKVHGVSVTVADELMDGRSAMRWIKQHASDLGIDPSRVIGAGESAGASMVLSLTFGDGPNDPKDDVSSNPSPVAMLLYCPGAMGRLRDPALQGEADPVTHLRKGAPPALMIYGENDPYRKEGELFAAQLKRAGDNIELWILPKAAHAPMEQAATRPSELRIADDWLQRHGFVEGTQAIEANPAYWPPRRQLLP